MKRVKHSLRHEWPFLLWLTFLWVALWQDFSALTVLSGVVVAFIALRILYLPPVGLNARFNVFAFVWFAVLLVGRIVAASVRVAVAEVTQGPRVRGGVIAVQLDVHSDLIVTVVAQTVSLIPGSLVVDVDRATNVMYLHVLDAASAGQVRAARREAQWCEEWVVRVMGSRAEVEEMRARRALEKSSASPSESADLADRADGEDKRATTGRKEGESE